MAVAVTATAVLLGLIYLRSIESGLIQEGLAVGSLWFVMCILIDASLMLIGGPMKMTFGAYMADIGLTYLSIPIVTAGLGMAKSRQGRG